MIRPLLASLASFFLLLTSQAAPTFGLGNAFSGGGGVAEITARLVSENITVPAGQPFWIGLEIKHPEGWHSYWVNSGAESVPMDLRLKLPEGATTGPIVWTLPHVVTDASGTRYEREGTTLDLVEINPPPSFTDGQEMELSADVKSQICSESNCLSPKSQPLKLTVKAGPAAVPDPALTAAFAAVRKQAAKTTPAWNVSITGQTITVRPGPGAKGDLGDLHYLNYNQDFNTKPEFLTQQNGIVRVSLTRQKEGASPAGILLASHGWAEDGSMPALAIGSPPGPSKPVVAAAEPAEPEDAVVDESDFEPGYTPFETEDAQDLGFVWAAIFAFLGGLILNLMPCVFPVLGLKVLSFVKLGGEDPRKVWMHGLAFTLGLVSFVWIFAAIIVGAKHFGGNVNWGFQLQSPTFMATIVAMLVIMGLWMGGLFEFGTQLTQAGNISTGGGYRGSFFSGVLTTVVATPCTGPFLGSAMGYAVQQPPLGVFVLFTFLGLGIAAPYLLLAASPGLIKRLPKPGAWMETFKKLLAFPVFMAAAYFLYTFGSLTGLASQAWFLFALIVAALGLYIYHHWAGPYASGKSRTWGTLTALALVSWSVWLTVGAIRDKVVERTQDKDWLEWSPGLVAKLRAEGRTVFVDFTTPGCSTCQVNEKRVFHSPGSERVHTLIQQHHVALVKADDRDPDDHRIISTINAVGRVAYPTNLIYPGKKKPLLLRELLDQDHVLRALEAAEKLKIAP